MPPFGQKTIFCSPIALSVLYLHQRDLMVTQLALKLKLINKLKQVYKLVKLIFLKQSILRLLKIILNTKN